jgi:hypothetical protein
VKVRIVDVLVAQELRVYDRAGEGIHRGMQPNHLNV